MQAIYERQDLTPADVERLRAARQELQRQEEMLEREVEAIDSDIWKEEMSIAKLLEQVRMPVGLLAGWWKAIGRQWKTPSLTSGVEGGGEHCCCCY